jgi:maltose alpha-D-glucosyltransferase/alpha-amylase
VPGWNNDESRVEERGQHRISLEAFGYRWFRIGRLDHLLTRRNA